MVEVTQKPGLAGDDRPPTQADIGRALGLSRQAVSKLAKAGMPTHSIAAAHEWRCRKLHPARIKRGPVPYADEARINEAVARAFRLMTLAGDALQEDPEGAFPALVPELRRAMAAVPEAGRDRVPLDFAVMDELTREVCELIEHCQAQDRAQAAAGTSNAAPDEATPGALAEDDAAAMGAFWYEIACGERVLEPGPNFEA